MLFERKATFCLLLFYFSSQSGLGLSSLKECNRPLGLQDGRISNSQLSAPQHYEHFYIGNGKSVHLRPEFARLNNTLAWCSPARRNSNSTYIEIDLKQRVNVSGIATQGFMGINAYYVKQYKVAYSDDGVTWEPFKEVWRGNSDALTVVKNTFNPLISARFLRIYPVKYKYRVCMRIELYGCKNYTMGANHGLPVVPAATVSVATTAVHGNQSTATSSLLVTPTLSSVKAASPMPSSVDTNAANHAPTSVNGMKEPLHTTTLVVPWSVISQETVVVAQTGKGVGEKNFLPDGPEHVPTSLVIALSITAAFMVIVMVPVIMFLTFLRQQKHKRCKSPRNGDCHIPLATAVIDENLYNQELHDTYVYSAPAGKCNLVEMNFLNQCAV